MLAAIEALSRAHPVTLVPTFMGAHEVPDEYRGGFREPANLRERLQAARGEFSSGLR